ncbi:MAG: hypothetical protein ISEC1_P1736 [Thiomicrorhabdus sp.]|nr:MAG: hypothetical protein ISEC1_P1736 [Thiomicrorhabdus sp.]
MTNTQPLSVHLITGLLGSGKTTALKQLIAQKPQDENWGFIINEFGDIDIDAATLSQSNTDNPVLSVSGGCVCCTAQHGLSQAINQLLTQQTDDNCLTRLWIEPTGLGHPAKIIDTLTRSPFAQPLSLQKIVCVITAQQLTEERWQKSAVMRDLVTLSDIILLNKDDTCSKNEAKQAIQLLENLYPPKQVVIKTVQSQVELTTLLQPPPAQKLTLLSSLKHKAPLGEQVHLEQVKQVSKTIHSTLPCVQRCMQQTNPDTGVMTSIGWIFDASVQFNRNQLKHFFEILSPVLSRAKGILKTGNEWQLINWSKNGEQTQLTFEDIAWRQDSRLECLFNTDTPDKNQLKTDNTIEAQLLSCISKHS